MKAQDYFKILKIKTKQFNQAIKNLEDDFGFRAETNAKRVRFISFELEKDMHEMRKLLTDYADDRRKE